MKLKRFAMKGLIVLAVVVALCMFFARTVQTITTPKVQIVTGSTGRFEQELKFTAKVEFPEKEDIILEDAAKSNIVIDKLYVQPGHWVTAGETIFTAHLPSYEEDMKKLQEDYQTKSQELLDLDITNRKLSKESKQNELYDELLDSQDKLAELTYQTRFAAMQAGINLTGDPTEWKKQLAALKDVPKEITDAVDKTVAAKGAVEAARTAFFEVYENRKLRVSDEVFKYIKDRNAALEALDKLQEQMVALDSRNASLSKVTAPRDGYIVSVDVAEGDTYDGTKLAYAISGKDVAPVLKASLNNNARNITEGAKATHYLGHLWRGKNHRGKGGHGDGRKQVYAYHPAREHGGDRLVRYPARHDERRRGGKHHLSRQQEHYAASRQRGTQRGRRLRLCLSDSARLGRRALLLQHEGGQDPCNGGGAQRQVCIHRGRFELSAGGG